MQTQSYVPPAEILEKYAKVLVNYALNSGEGVKPGEVVQFVVHDVSKPMALQLQNVLLKSGAHGMLRYLPTGFEKDFFNLANDDQLTFFPEEYIHSRVNTIDHQIYIIADVDPYELKDVDPAKIIKARDSQKKYREWITEKETQGKFTWTLGLWGVEAKAKLVGLTLEEYWQQIIKACFLDYDDPVAEWKKLSKAQEIIKGKLNEMRIESLHMKGKDSDIVIKLGAERIWQGGSGRNIPSFEFFTSPDWRGTEGWVQFNQPVYRYGQVMKDVYLKFEKGHVVKSKAKVGDKLLQQMFTSENADKAGEFSLTDKDMSRITHTMAETLFDENIGGPFGNSHIAVGMAYKDCYRGDAAKLTKEDWQKLGYNESSEHTDIVTTTDRTVTATLTDGTKKVIYAKGKFQL